MLYRIFTEDIKQENIEEIVKRFYPGFTIMKGEGFWRAQKEGSLIIEIVTKDEDAKITKMASDIRDKNDQESVLVQKIQNHQWLV